MYTLKITEDELLQIKAGAGSRILESRRMLEIYKNQNMEHKFNEAMQWEIKTNEEIIRKCVEIQHKENKFNSKHDLSTREKEVLQLLKQGKTTQEIAEILYIANNTAKKHICNIYSKIGCKTRVELINFL